MRNYFSLPQFNPGDMRINTAPVQNALEAYGATRQCSLGKSSANRKNRPTSAAGTARQDARQDETLEKQNLERLGKAAFAILSFHPNSATLRRGAAWSRGCSLMTRRSAQTQTT
jgi:hypothetical protein